MTDGFWNFRAKAESRRHLLRPAVQCLLGRDCIESCVTLHRSQTPRIFAQEFGGLGPFRIKISDPALPRPNGTTDIEIHRIYNTFIRKIFMKPKLSYTIWFSQRTGSTL